MRCFRFLFRSPSALLVALLLSSAAVTAQSRNILLVLADDLGVDKLASYGEGSAPPPTPTVDRLAQTGVLFRNAWSCPLCSPTRASIQTGRYPFRHGVGSAIPAAPPLAQAETTLPEALDGAASGYDHAAFGKWHLGGSNATGLGRLDPNLQGYGHFAGSLPGAFVAPFDYALWPKTVDGEVTISTRYATTDNVDDALRWIRSRTRPWLCYLAFNAPHTPFHAPPAHLHSQTLTGDPCVTPIPYYDAMVEAMDTELGRLLAALDATTRANTIVIFVGDNGTTGAVTTAPFDPDRAKGTLYQGGVRVPLIVSGAGVRAPGREQRALVHVVDLLATVLELAGVDPQQAVPDGTTLDAVSLLPYLQNPLQAPRRVTVFTEAFVGSGDNPGPTLPNAPSSCLAAGAQAAQGQAIRDATGFKLIRNDRGRQELYDLRIDPFERRNLYLPGIGPFGVTAQQHYAQLNAALDALLASDAR